MPPHRSMSIQSSMLATKSYARPVATPTRRVSIDDREILVQDQSGFPTFAQYKAIETRHLESLSPKRRSKSLISQALFDRIWDVLARPLESLESAQFRYWVRNMFQFGHSSDYYAGQGVQVLHDSDIVLIHDDALVAVQERLYPLLCHFHGLSQHAGRDRTCALVRQHYTWVPKDLIAQFVKICPTCKLKKRGRIASAPCSPTVSQAHDSGTLSEPSSPAAPPVAPLDSYLATKPHLQSVLSAPTRSANLPAGLGLHSLPMSREVSLYQGLPNGWQFHSDYAAAREACIKLKKLQGGRRSINRRPRIPSIVPLIQPRTIQELMNAYLPANDGSHTYCIDPALLSPPLSASEESLSFSSEDVSNDNKSTRSLYTLRNVDISELNLSPGSPSSSNYLIPGLIAESLIDLNYDSEDSPTVTELPTPQDESVKELAGSRGLKFSSTQGADAQSSLIQGSRFA